MKKKLLLFTIVLLHIPFIVGKGYATRWSADKINAWYAQREWLRGCNFQPSTAVNQLEMWQKESFDPMTINRELSWAAALGFNCMRVYLHHLAWETDKEGFKKRVREYLSISGKYGISTVFVFLMIVGIPLTRQENSLLPYRECTIPAGYAIQAIYCTKGQS